MIQGSKPVIPEEPGRGSATAPKRKWLAEEAGRSAVLIEPPEEVAGFVRTLFTLLRVCDPEVITWSADGTAMAIHDPIRFAAEICPKFFRHRNFNSFTRLLNMYQFHKVPGAGKDKTVSFVHSMFQRGREDLLAKIRRKGSDKLGGESDVKKPTKRGSEKSPCQSETAKHHASSTIGRKTACDTEKAAVKARRVAGNVERTKRGSPIFPSEAHYRAAAGSPEALIGKDIWVRTNKEINELEKNTGYLSQTGGPSAVSTWMRRVVELEKESRLLKAENDRLRFAKSEIQSLKDKILFQQQCIGQLQVESALTMNTPPTIAGAPTLQSNATVSMVTALIGNGSDTSSTLEVYVPERPALGAFPPGATPEQLWCLLSNQSPESSSSSDLASTFHESGAFTIISMLSQLQAGHTTGADVGPLN